MSQTKDFWTLNRNTIILFALVLRVIVYNPQTGAEVASGDIEIPETIHVQ